MSDEPALRCLITAIETDNTVHMLVKLSAAEVERAVDRPPLQLCLVLDCSGSMAGPKLERAKEASRLLVRRLSASDRISVVVFSDVVQTRVLPQSAALKEPIFEAIDGIEAGGRTNLSGGLLRGLEYLAAGRQDDDSKVARRLLLLTDGHANEGITDPDKLIHTVGDARRRKEVVTTALGFGEGFNEDLLSEMAIASTGSFYYIEQPDDAPAVFAEELDDLQNLVAQNVAVQITFGEVVHDVRQITSHPGLETEDSHIFELGDARAGEEKRLLLALRVPGLEQLGTPVVANVVVRFTEIGAATARLQSITQDVRVNVFTDEQAGDQGQRVELLQELAMQESAEARRKALAFCDAGNYEGSAAQLRAVAERLEALPDDVRNAAIDDEIRALKEQADEADALNRQPELGSQTRKRLVNETHTISLGRYHKTDTMRLRRGGDVTRLFKRPGKTCNDQDDSASESTAPDSVDVPPDDQK